MPARSGRSLAGAAPFEGNIRARYEFALNGLDAFAQIGAGRKAHSVTTTDHLKLDVQGNSVAYDLPGRRCPGSRLTAPGSMPGASID